MAFICFMAVALTEVFRRVTRRGLLAIAAIIWIVYPRWRWACGLASLAVAVGLVGMNYHFVGDVIAGGFVGGIVGTYIAHYSGLGEDFPVQDASQNKL